MGNAIIVLYSLQALLHLSLCIFLACKCFEDKMRFGKKRTTLVAVAFIAISIMIIELFLERTAPFPGHVGLVGAIWSVITIACAMLAFRASILHLLFMAFFLMNITLNTTYMSRQIEALDLFPKGEVAYILISIGVLCFVAPFMWYLVVRLFKRVVSLNFSDKYLRWLFMLPLAYFVLYSITGSALYASKGWFGLVALLVSNGATYLSYVAVLQMFLKMHDSLVATAKVQFSEQLVSMQKEQYRQMAHNIEETARMEHDFRHNLIVLKSFVERGDLAGLNEYLDGYEKANVVVDLAPLCNHHLVDVILRHYVTLAKQEDVATSLKVHFSEGIPLADDEAVVLFGNLLENALEGCLRQKDGERFIKVRTKTVSNSMLAIKVSNSYGGAITRKDSLFLSSKHSGTGIGVSTICCIAEKNGGEATFSFNKGVFTVRVLLISKT